MTPALVAQVCNTENAAERADHPERCRCFLRSNIHIIPRLGACSLVLVLIGARGAVNIEI